MDRYTNINIFINVLIVLYLDAMLECAVPNDHLLAYVIM